MWTFGFTVPSLLSSKVVLILRLLRIKKVEMNISHLDLIYMFAIVEGKRVQGGVIKSGAITFSWQHTYANMEEYNTKDYGSIDDILE